MSTITTETQLLHEALQTIETNPGWHNEYDDTDTCLGSSAGVAGEYVCTLHRERATMDRHECCRECQASASQDKPSKQENLKDSDEELYCAECILDTYAVDLLPEGSQGFDCIGEYIKAIVEAALIKNKV
jgi:hypothetical protein